MITVAICTYNRAASLRKTLASFAACQAPAEIAWELLVVDNASTDSTRDVVQEFETALPLRYFFEPKQGLSHARNRAVSEAAGSELILFTDDDVRVETGWIAAFVAAADAHPEIDFFGGRVKPLFEGGRPAWLADENMDLLDGLFVNYDPGARSREITSGEILPVGASMGFRRNCFDGNNLFRTDLGVCGRNKGRGEDTELLDRLMKSGRRGFYVADALSHHEVAPERLTYTYAFRYGMACAGGSCSIFQTSLFLIRGLRQLLIGRGDRARQCAIRAGMQTPKVARPISLPFLLALLGLAMLPLAPELYLCLRHHDGLKFIISITYYEMIVSFLLLAPALILPHIWGRFWALAIGGIECLATLIVGFEAFTVGARWDLTPHEALMRTNLGEAKSYLQEFVSCPSLIGATLLVAGFAVCVATILRSSAPPRRVSLAIFLFGLLASSHGISNAIRYGGKQFRAIQVEDGPTMEMADIGINKFHPVPLLLITHFNYCTTHGYYLKALRETADHAAEFQGAIPVPGAMPPRLIVVVIGESSNRNHWSLYGYPRETTPELRSLGNDLIRFSDVISFSTGTQTVLRGMFTTKDHSLPIFPLFSAAGYRTHWLSAQYSQGPNDAGMMALVRSADDRVFLNGTYDENLLPLIKKAAQSPGKNAIFVNLFGSHIRYEDRYPSRFAIFHGEGEKEHRIATYDNTIRYTDHVLKEIIEILRSRDESSCLLFVSDHGEDVYDSLPDTYLFRSETLATNPMYEVPFFVWFSPEYRRQNPTFVLDVEKSRQRKYQTRGLYSSIIDLARFTHPMYAAKSSVFSPGFEETARRVGGMSRPYTK